MFIEYQAVPQDVPALEIAEQVPLLDRFYRNMPYKPHYGYKKGEPLHIGLREDAISKARLIQFNSPISTKYLVVDLDDHNALFSYQDKGLPPPHIIIENLTNGHCHYVYELALPVLTGKKAHLHPIRYFNNIQRQLYHEFDADTGFTHYICKNPFIVDDSQRVLYGQFPAYTLDDLAKYVDLEKVPLNKKLESFANGSRNCELFDGVRQWAYSQKRHHNSLYSFEKEVLDFAVAFNSGRFHNPLGYNEVRATAKSISKWTWRHYNGSHARQEKSEELSNLGRRGGHAKRAAYCEIRTRARKLFNKGSTKKFIAAQVGVTRQTIHNWIKKYRWKYYNVSLEVINACYSAKIVSVKIASDNRPRQWGAAVTAHNIAIRVAYAFSCEPQQGNVMFRSLVGGAVLFAWPVFAASPSASVGSTYQHKISG